MQRAMFEQLLEHKDCSVKWQASSVKRSSLSTVCLARSCGGGMYYTSSVKWKTTTKKKHTKKGVVISCYLIQMA